MNRIRTPLATIGLGLVLLALALAIVVLTPGLGSPAVRASAPTTSKFCSLGGKVARGLPTTLADVAPAQARTLAKQLKAASASAPKAVTPTVRTLIIDLRAVVGASSPATRAAIVGNQAAGYAAAALDFSTYHSHFCPASVPDSPNFGPVGSAKDALCGADASTIRMAEDLYSGVNGGYAPMDQLVSAGYLRSVSAAYSEIIVDTPPGGYTLMAAPNTQCGNVPVAP